VGIWMASFSVTPAPNPVSPDDFANLRGWWSADYGVYTDAGMASPAGDTDLVYTWEDRSGNALNFVQATEANRPTYKVNQINSLPVIETDGTSRALLTSRILSDDNFSIFAVARAVSSAASVLLAQNLAGGFSSTTFFRGAGSNKFGTTFTLDDGSTTYNLVSTSTPFDGTVYNVLITESNGAGLTEIRNGLGAVEDSENGPVWTPRNTPASLFARGGLGLPMTGSIAELIIYDSKLSEDDRISVTNYLLTKYGL